MAWRTVVTIAAKELRDAGRNRWVLILAVGFAVLSMTLSWLGQAGLGTLGVSGFARTTASLLNAVLLIVPLLGLLMGAVSIAGEREHGTLLTLMAQPVTPQEIVCGKFLGAAAALALAVALGFGLSGLIIARSAGPGAVGQYLALGGLTVLLGMVYLAMGFGISVFSARMHPAISVALIVWVAATLLSDLGLMGTAIALRLTPAQLLWCALGNPSQAFRIANVHLLQGSLDLLGSSGAYAASLLGHRIVLVVIALLVGWVGGVLGAALLVFRRRGAL